jgi:hypothetical protein
MVVANQLIWRINLRRIEPTAAVRLELLQGDEHGHLRKRRVAEPLIGWRFDMSVFSDSYVLWVLLAPARRLDGTAQRWHRLRVRLCDPYRPELHYMRGPGPKWREKHQQR